MWRNLWNFTQWLYLSVINQKKTSHMTDLEFKNLKKQVDALLAKQKAGTISKQEHHELYTIMFGLEFMESDDKGARKTYNA